MSGWIGVDLDGTLAVHEEGQWKGVSHIGEPIAPMVERVKQWLAEGIEVRIFTARVAGHGLIEAGKKVDAITPIQDWCKKHIGRVLPVTNVKDFKMWQLWDDRAVQVVMNRGLVISELLADKTREVHMLRECNAQLVANEQFIRNAKNRLQGVIANALL